MVLTLLGVALLHVVFASPDSTSRQDAAAKDTRPLFRISTDDFWLNLHHYLYVLGRAEAKMSDTSRRAVADAPADMAKGLAALTPAERSVWETPSGITPPGRAVRIRCSASR